MTGSVVADPNGRENFNVLALTRTRDPERSKELVSLPTNALSLGKASAELGSVLVSLPTNALSLGKASAGLGSVLELGLAPDLCEEEGFAGRVARAAGAVRRAPPRDAERPRHQHADLHAQASALVQLRRS